MAIGPARTLTFLLIRLVVCQLAAAGGLNGYMVDG